jgi:RHS repeat-associated protein
MEVRNEAYFCPFVLALVEDASGGEAYYYGRQGEVTKTVRTVMASVADIRTYVYGATYDSWNRVQTMTYPDGEVVTYHYNAAGQVESMTSNKQGRQSVIVDRIGYDKEGHTVYTKLGNGTETIYTYDKQRERLQVMNLTADGQTVMENRYQYDAVDNILGITNAANPTSLTKLNKAKLGGRSSHTYEYDELNRLIHANGKAKRASYDMVMSFGRMSEPLTKVQKVDSTTTAKSYNFAYKYEDSNHPTAPTQIGNDHYTYDANGNPTLVTNDSTNTTREMYWDEDNRLMVLSDNGKTSRYTYNAAGERIMKSYGTMEGVYINGAPQGITFHETDNFTLYPASIISINKNRFTKHYFIGDKRIASRIGTGLFNNVYGRNGSYVTAGQQDYAERMNQIQKQKEAYYKQQGIAPGVPTMKGAYGDPENTGVGYNAVLTELGNHDVPQGWIQTPRPNTTPNTNPGPPVSWNDPSNPDAPQAGYGYIPNDTTKEETFFYHSDHLGSTSYITDDKANITQYDAYLPYGELLVDEHSSSEDLPYKFNGKQFDEETGLYYYGARYMNPMASIWYGVDPLAEKYVTAGGYIYTLENPINLVDPDGNKVIPKLYVNDSKKPVSYYRSPKNFSKAMKAFAKTTYGKKVLADFTEKGKTIFGVKGNGKYAKFDLVLDEEAFTDQQIRTAKFLDNDGSWIAAQTQMSKDQDGKPQFTIIFDLSYSSDELTETVTHEFSVHLSRYSGVLDTYMKTDNYKAAEKIWKNLSGNDEHHDLIRRSPKLPGSKLYYKTASELIGQNKKLKSIFNDASKYHKKHY